MLAGTRQCTGSAAHHCQLVLQNLNSDGDHAGLIRRRCVQAQRELLEQPYNLKGVFSIQPASQLLIGEAGLQKQE